MEAHMDAQTTLRGLILDAKAWHLALAAWVGKHPKTTVGIGLVLAGLAALRIVGWVL
jgi:hypothetical protein